MNLCISGSPPAFEGGLGGPRPLAYDEPQSIVVDGTSVYWTDINNVNKVPLHGGNRTILASGNYLTRIAVDAVNVYAVSLGDVVRVPIDGGALTTLASGSNDIRSLVTDGNYVYWVEIPGPLQEFLVDGGLVLRANNGPVMKVPVGGGTAITLAADQGGPFGIAVNARNVYWTNIGDGTVMRVPLAGGAPTMVASGQRNPAQIALDATSIYWTTDIAVLKAPLEGGPPVRVTSANSALLDVAPVIMDGTVYWLDASGLASTTFDGSRRPTVSLVPDAFGFALSGADVYWIHGGSPFRDSTIPGVYTIPRP